jgi:hypothetical protein
VPLRRLDGDDNDGILHIGTTGVLADRIAAFQQTALQGKGGSQSGWWFSHYGYVRKFALDSLYADCIVKATEDDARALERQLHEDYCIFFLDLPPLDRQV